MYTTPANNQIDGGPKRIKNNQFIKTNDSTAQIILNNWKIGEWHYPSLVFKEKIFQDGQDTILALTGLIGI